MNGVPNISYVQKDTLLTHEGSFYQAYKARVQHGTGVWDSGWSFLVPVCNIGRKRRTFQHGPIEAVVRGVPKHWEMKRMYEQ